MIGGLYNGRDVPTKSDVPLHDGLKKKAVRHTLSDRQGNRVDLLSQRTGGRKQGVRIASGNDKLTINLDRTKTEITVDSKGSVSITGSRSVSVDAGTDLSLSARRSLTIKSGGPLSIQGGSTINMRSGGLVGVNAGGALNLGAGGAATLSAGAATTISGTVNVQINSVMTRVIGATFEVKTPIFKVATIPVPGL